MSVKATMRPRGDQGPVAVEQQADSRPEPSLADQFGAARRVAKDEAPFVQRDRLADGYAPVIEAVAAATGKNSRAYWTDNLLRLDPLHPTDYGKVWGDIAALPAAVRKRLGVPATRAEFEQQVLRREQGGEGGRSADQATMARGTGLLSGVSQFGGGMVGTLQDPANAALLPVGGGGKTIATRILSEMAVGSGTTVLQLPGMAEARLALGEKLTAAEAGSAVVLAGAAGGAFRAVGEGAAAGARRFVPAEWRMAQALKQAVPRELRTPEQQAAIHVLERGADIDASNPFARTYAGVDAHAARIEATIADFHEPPGAGFVPKPANAVRPQEPGRARVGTGALDRAVVGFFRNKGYSEAQARGIAAGIHAESRSNPLARNPDSGALGIGQWLGPRKRAIIARYGENPTLEQQLEFLHGELQGGDPGGRKVLAQADEGAVLRSYIEDFMRPAKGRETTGDLERGMAALGRAGEAPAIGEGGLAGVDLGETGPLVRPEALDAVRPDVPDETPELRPEVVDDALVTGLRGLVADPAVSLNRLPELATALDAGEDQVRRALARLADEGAVTITKSGQVRRAGGGGVRGPDDALRFVARSGGISYDGLDARTRALVDGPKGHDLRNTGSLAAFIPGGGPLLRPEGRTLDEVAEALWDADYFGPPETTPRPSDVEVIEFLDQSLRTKTKRFSFFDSAPEKKATAADFDERAGAPQAVADEAFVARDAAARRAQWDAAAERAGIVPLFPHEIAAAQRIMAEGTDVLPPLAADPLPSPEALAPYLLEMVNREIDDVLEASYLEVEDPRYDTFLADYADDPTGQAGRAAGGGERPAADRGDAAAGGAGADPGGRDYPDQLSPAERDAAEAAGELPPTPFDEAALERFDDPVGDGAAKAADDAWHDIKAGVTETVTPEPALQPGMVRLYHSGSVGEGDTGRWVSTSRQYASDYRPGLPLHYIDVARTDPRVTNADFPEQSVAQGFTFNFELAPAEAALLKPIARKAVDPNIAALDRQKAQLGAASPMRGKVEQDGTGGLGLFDTANEPTFDLGDGQGPRKLSEIEAELDADQAAIDTIEGCMK